MSEKINEYYENGVKIEVFDSQGDAINIKTIKQGRLSGLENAINYQTEGHGMTNKEAFRSRRRKHGYVSRKEMSDNELKITLRSIVRNSKASLKQKLWAEDMLRLENFSAGVNALAFQIKRQLTKKDIYAKKY